MKTSVSTSVPVSKMRCEAARRSIQAKRHLGSRCEEHGHQIVAGRVLCWVHTQCAITGRGVQIAAEAK